MSYEPMDVYFTDFALNYFFIFCDRVELEVPNVEVRYKDLDIRANVQIGSRALPTLVNYTRDVLEVHFWISFCNFNS